MEILIGVVEMTPAVSTPTLALSNEVTTHFFLTNRPMSVSIPKLIERERPSIDSRPSMDSISIDSMIDYPKIGSPNPFFAKNIGVLEGRVGFIANDVSALERGRSASCFVW